MGSFSIWHWLIVLLVIVLIFGTKKLRNIGEDLGSAVKSMTEKLEREAPTLSDTQRATRQKQLVEQDRDFQRKRGEFQEDLSARRNEELQQVLGRANKVIRQLAETEKLDLIMQPDQVVYVSPKHDITDKVIKALNATGAK